MNRYQVVVEVNSNASGGILCGLDNATLRVKLSKIGIGFDKLVSGPNWSYGKYILYRTGTAGAWNSTVTPTALDPGAPPATTVLSYDNTFPPITQGVALQIPTAWNGFINWQARTGKELWATGGAGTGRGWRVDVQNFAFNTIGISINFEFEE